MADVARKRVKIAKFRRDIICQVSARFGTRVAFTMIDTWQLQETTNRAPANADYRARKTNDLSYKQQSNSRQRVKVDHVYDFRLLWPDVDWQLQLLKPSSSTALFSKWDKEMPNWVRKCRVHFRCEGNYEVGEFGKIQGSLKYIFGSLRKSSLQLSSQVR